MYRDYRILGWSPILLHQLMGYWSSKVHLVAPRDCNFFPPNTMPLLPPQLNTKKKMLVSMVFRPGNLLSIHLHGDATEVPLNVFVSVASEFPADRI